MGGTGRNLYLNGLLLSPEIKHKLNFSSPSTLKHFTLQCPRRSYPFRTKGLGRTEEEEEPVMSHNQDQETHMKEEAA